jgi:hypothetical protein
VVLLTRQSTRRTSWWVRWEIQEGARLAKERDLAFIPCLLGVGYEALQTDVTRRQSTWQQWEIGADVAPGHPEAEFQAIRLDEGDGLARLAQAVEQSLARGCGT